MRANSAAMAAGGTSRRGVAAGTGGGKAASAVRATMARSKQASRSAATMMRVQAIRSRLAAGCARPIVGKPTSTIANASAACIGRYVEISAYSYACGRCRGIAGGMGRSVL